MVRTHNTETVSTNQKCHGPLTEYNQSESALIAKDTKLNNETVENAYFTPKYTPYQNLTPPMSLADPENGFEGV